MSRPSPPTSLTRPSLVTTAPSLRGPTRPRALSTALTRAPHAARYHYAGKHLMTLPLTIALLALWSVAMIRYGRSVLFPPASLAIVWTITLLAIWVCGDIYYPLTNTANQIVLAGVLAFSAGGFCALAAPFRKLGTLDAVRTRRRMQVDRGLTAAGILLLLNIPLS